ncbi:MAG: GFA family protein [Alphaproteobacteria bacterium]|nr:GFA family protein [Alphaproteobacteria bacterium]
MTDALEGRCGCGSARYRLESPPMFVNCCHCLDCQRQTGSAFVINAVIEADRVKLISGETRAHRVPTASGRPHDIHRCATCGTALWSEYGGNTALRFVRVGSLDAPASLSPGAHIFTRSKLPWVALPEDVPAFAVYYELSKLWPAEAQARRKAALG